MDMLIFSVYFDKINTQTEKYKYIVYNILMYIISSLQVHYKFWMAIVLVDFKDTEMKSYEICLSTYEAIQNMSFFWSRRRVHTIWAVANFV